MSIFLNLNCSLCKFEREGGGVENDEATTAANDCTVDSRTHRWLVRRDTAKWIAALRNLLRGALQDCVIWTVRKDASNGHGLHLYVCNYLTGTSSMANSYKTLARLLDCAAVTNNKILRLEPNCTNVQTDAFELNESYLRWRVLSGDFHKDRSLNRCLDRCPIQPSRLAATCALLKERLDDYAKAKITRITCSHVPIAIANFDFLCGDGPLGAVAVALAGTMFPWFELGTVAQCNDIVATTTAAAAAAAAKPTSAEVLTDNTAAREIRRNQQQRRPLRRSETIPFFRKRHWDTADLEEGADTAVGSQRRRFM